MFPHVTAQPAAAGDIIWVHGRFFDLSGPECQTCYVQVLDPKTDDVRQSRGIQVNRHWGGFYAFEVELPPVDQPGAYRIQVIRLALYYKEPLLGSIVVSAKRKE
jgi:hypothetical protein